MKRSLTVWIILSGLAALAFALLSGLFTGCGAPEEGGATPAPTTPRGGGGFGLTAQGVGVPEVMHAGICVPPEPPAGAVTDQAHGWCVYYWEGGSCRIDGSCGTTVSPGGADPGSVSPGGGDDSEGAVSRPVRPRVGLVALEQPVSISANPEPEPPLEVTVDIRSWTTPSDWCLPVANVWRVRMEAGRFVVGDFATYEDPARSETHEVGRESVHLLEADVWRPWAAPLRYSLVGSGEYLAGAAHYAIPEQDTGDYRVWPATRLVIFAGDRCEP